MGRTGHDGEHGDHEPGEGDGEGRKRIDLSLSQVAGAGAATLTAATAASYLNVYGTVIGAAVIAILSTVASPLLQHWFTRGGEQARQLAGRVRTGDAARAGGASAGRRAAAAPLDATRTMALPAVADGPDGPRRPAGSGGPEDAGAAETGAPARPRPNWRTLVIPAAVVFVLVMLVILAFELLTGRSLTAWTNGVDEPTAPSLLGGTHITQEQDDDTGSTDTGDTSEQDTGTTGDQAPPADEVPDDTATSDDAPAGDGTGQEDGEEQQEQPDPGATAPPADGGAGDEDQTTVPETESGTGGGDGQGSAVVPEDVPATQ